MWPRAVFEQTNLRGGAKTKKMLSEEIAFLSKPGVYVLYKDDQPYYIGQATRLRDRLWNWAKEPRSRYYHFWNFFSVFVVKNPELRNELEGILIACMPSANSAMPKLKREPMPKQVRNLLKKIYREKR